ncbi:WxL protein peptidoglycan domain-containing protein [Kribbella sp. NPDC051620]|uniref:WxL protein peptidoglycan domain-containing protein n=1 Tax=Kribbella sp. NPDC051620 TaxID=3364120 RepID=UPI00379AD6BE
MHPPVLRGPTVLHTVTRAIAILLLALPAVGQPQSALAADKPPWEIKPAAGIFGANRSSFSYALPRGGQLRDGLLIVNRGRTPLTATLHGADAFTADDGSIELRSAEAQPRDVGAWIQLADTTVRVPAGRSVDVPFRLALPDTATPGDHLGGIVTLVQQAGTTDRLTTTKIRLQVSGELKPALTVEDLKVHYSGTPNPFGEGSVAVTYTVRNTGNIIVAARQSAAVTGPFGVFTAGPGQLADSPQLLPGETWQVAASIPGVPPALRLTGTVSVVPVARSAPQPTTAATAHVLTIPWTLLLLLIGCAGVLTLALLSRRNRKRPAHAR